jgi:purine-nucleoside/S-methyl-5'-thioadenosine phosphorylase / adenosine deaminase
VSATPHSDWIIPDWPAPGRIRALVTTRSGGVSTGAYAGLNLGERVGDDPGCVARNRAIVRACLPVEPQWMRQVHGTAVIELRPAPTEVKAEVEADAAVARTPRQVCAVLTADCLPVLLCDREGSVVGIAHAGWRGLAAGIIDGVVRAMNAPPGNLMAYLGPGIGPRSYEVGGEVREAFVRQDARAAAAFTPRPGGKYLADLYALARQRLAAAGVGEVHGGEYCTLSEARFFSFRRDRNTGRMASLIWIEGS